MTFINQHLLTLMALIVPLGGALITLALRPAYARIAALVSTVGVFMLALHMFHYFDGTSAELQFIEQYAWFPTYGISYFVGIDGISLLLVLLTAFLFPLLVLSLWRQLNDRLNIYLALLLFLQAGIIGSLVSLDLVLFYVFWEVMLIPMYFIIGMWGGKKRLYATMKFFIYTAFGSLWMLLAAIALYVIHFQQTGEFSANLLELYRLDIAGYWQHLLCAGFMLAFAIKVPLFPFHTWLPDAHTEAPTAGSVILAGVLLKLGIYGLLRFAIPLFPDAVHDFAPFLLGFGVIGIIYGALTAWAQRDAKRLVAYSSVSHLGFVVIGSFSLLSSTQGLSEIALTGAIYQMINHGISTGALFFLIGAIYERAHTRQIADYGGLAANMPIFAVMLIVATLGSIGLPATGGFVGEFYILLGAFAASPYVAIAATFGVLLGAIYMLSLCRRILFGERKNPDLKDLSGIEVAYLLPLILLVVIMGVMPEYFLAKTKPAIAHLANNFRNYHLTVRNTDTAVAVRQAHE
ncbi:MAG: NADH-quinone oxidoreductase subunit M [Pseudomonadota bacterium]|nr:NADH-quinone oxidoreductase subunit M [Pseudomonadota bacterium]